MTDQAKRISFMLGGATWAEFTSDFVFPNCSSARSTAGLLFDFSSTLFMDESESGEYAATSSMCHSTSSVVSHPFSSDCTRSQHLSRHLHVGSEELRVWSYSECPGEGNHCRDSA